MYINKINSSNQTFGSLYFTKIKPVFNNKVNLVEKAGIKLSDTGVRYKEDNKISECNKERFEELPFIKELSEKFDTFVMYIQDAKNSLLDEHADIAFISWADRDKEYASEVVVIGTDKNKHLATAKMFDNLKNGKFLNMSL